MVLKREKVTTECEEERSRTKEVLCVCVTKDNEQMGERRGQLINIITMHSPWKERLRVKLMRPTLALPKETQHAIGWRVVQIQIDLTHKRLIPRNVRVRMALI